MNFNEQLQAFLKQIECSGIQLSKASDLSNGTLSRYRSGERTPGPDSKHMRKLAKGISELSLKNGTNLSEEYVLKVLNETVGHDLLVNYSAYVANLNRLVSALEISNTDLARNLKYDPSHVSRLLSGQRKPTNMRKFTVDIASYIAGHRSDESSLPKLAALLECDVSQIGNAAALADKIVNWLGSNTKTAQSYQQFS